ncbi:MAG: cation diffusion facilitator family transporter [Sulfuritalea sp.]|jgi:cobalt-zinc-cadmium efflux system protein|nr:cation diffusion facilitator family transporter [Sulfuritalea sp.]
MSMHAPDQHGHHHGPAEFSRAFAIGIALNIGFVAVEAFYGWRVDSLALLADAGHNLADVAGLVLAWVAALAAGRQPDHRHTYGWQRASILAAFANAVLLLVAMGSLLWEAAHRLQSPAPTDGITIMVVAAIGVLINGATAALFMAGSKADMNIRGAFLHMAADALVSLGVVVSGAVYLKTGWAWLDPLTSMAIALAIIAGTWSLFRQSLHLLFDGVPESVILAEVDALLRALPGVTEVHDLHVWAMSTTDIALSAHLVMPCGCPGDDFLERIAHELHDHFHITHPTIQIETDGLDHGCAQPLKTCE